MFLQNFVSILTYTTYNFFYLFTFKNCIYVNYKFLWYVFIFTTI